VLFTAISRKIKLSLINSKELLPHFSLVDEKLAEIGIEGLILAQLDLFSETMELS
jgi:hypothetical protein